MTLKLTNEQRTALDQRNGSVEYEDDQTQKRYVLIEADLYHGAMQALETQETRRAIRAGIEDLRRLVESSQLNRGSDTVVSGDE